MNILFFLTPKSEVIYVNEEDTVGQNKIERLGRSWEMHHGF